MYNQIPGSYKKSQDYFGSLFCLYIVLGQICGIFVCFALCVFPYIRLWRQPSSCLASLMVTMSAVRILAIFMFLTASTYCRIHYSLALSGKWLMDSLCSHVGRWTMEVYFFSFSGFFPLFSSHIRRGWFHMQCSFCLTVGEAVEAMWLLWYTWSHQLLLHLPAGSFTRRP